MNLLAIIDELGAKVTWLALKSGRWKCVVSEIGLPPHHGIGRTPLHALQEVLRMAEKLGWYP